MRIIANILTGSRIVLGPLFLYSYLNLGFRFSLLILIFAGLSDLFDGHYARKDKVTVFGGVFDVVADKIFVGFVILAYIISGFSLYILALILMREILQIIFVLVLLVFGKFKKEILKSSLLGKLTTLFQGIAIVLIFFRIDVEIFAYVIGFIGLVCVIDYGLKAFDRKSFDDLFKPL